MKLKNLIGKFKNLSHKERLKLLFKYGVLAGFIVLTITLCVESLMPGSISSQHSSSVGSFVNVPVDKITQPKELRIEGASGKLDPDVKVGDSISLVPIFSPSGTTYKQVKYTVSDKNIASLSGDIIKFKAEGTVTLTATSVYNKNISDSFEFNVTAIPASGIEIKKIDSLQIYETAVLSATVFPSDATDKRIKFTSDSDCVKIEGSTVTALREGEAEIIATCGSVSDSFTLTVIKIQPQSISFIYDGSETDTISANMFEDISISLSVIPGDVYLTDVEWDVDKDFNAYFTALDHVTITPCKAGTGTVSATIGDLTATLTIEIMPVPMIIKDVLAPAILSDIRLCKGEGQSAVRLNRNETITDYSFEVVEGDDYISVDKLGLIKAFEVGEAKIRIVGPSGEEFINVFVDPVRIKEFSISAPKKIQVGKNYNLEYSFAPKNACVDPIWTVSDSSIASVEGGVLIFNKAGTVTVTATVGDIVSTAELTAKNILKINSIKGIGFDKDVTIKENTSATLKHNSSAIFSIMFDKTATYKDVEITSSDPQIISVSDKIVTALEIGKATITFTYWDGSEDTPKTTYNVEITVVEQRLSDVTTNYSYIIRKSIGHFGAFLVLGIFASITFALFIRNKYLSMALTITSGFAIAGLTEILQLMTPNRYGAFSDVLLDYTGFCCSAIPILICFVIVWTVIYFKSFKSNKKSDNSDNDPKTDNNSNS